MNGQTVLRIGTKLEEGIGRIHVCPMLFIMKVHVNPRPTHVGSPVYVREPPGTHARTDEPTCAGQGFT